MKPTGIQFVAEFINCSKHLLNDKKALEDTLKLGLKSCGFDLRSIKSHKFNPVGVTVVAIIGESHIAIHTYPEARHASLDIFACSASPEKLNNLLLFLKSKFKPKTVQVIELLRGNPVEVKGENWITSFSQIGFGIRFHVKKRIFSKKSKYQQIDVIENDNFGRMLFLDRDVQVAENGINFYNESMVYPLIERKSKLNKVAILGGGDGGVLYELLKYNPKEVFLVDIDGDVIKVCKKFLRKVCYDAFDDSRVIIVVDDANNFLEKNDGFDAIIYDLTMHPESLTRDERSTFINRIFFKIKNSLNKRGIVSLQCCSKYDNETLKLVKRILAKYFKNIEFKQTFIPPFSEYWIFGSAKLK